MKPTIKKLQKVFGCSNITKFAEICGIKRAVMFNAQNGKAGKGTLRMLEMLEIFVDNSTKASLDKSIDKIKRLD